jgi:hypothetical protein
MWILEGLFINLLSHLFPLFLSVLGIVVVLLVILKLKTSYWADLISYVLSVVTFLVVIFYVFLPQIPQVTPDNIDTHVRTWLDNFSVSSKRINYPDSHFAYQVTFSGERNILVSRLKRFDKYLTLSVGLVLIPQYKALLDNATEEQKAQLKHILTLEMARFKTNSELSPTLQSMRIIRRIPITSNLTEGMFIEILAEVQLAGVLGEETFLFALNKLTKDNSLPTLR